MKNAFRYGLPLLGLTILSFFLGNVVVEFRLFPYEQFLGPVFDEGRAHLERWTADGSPSQTNLWFVASDRPEGVTVNKPGKRAEGYTLFTSPYPNGAILVNPTGEIVHVWHNRFRKVWPMASRIRSAEPVANTHWRKVHLFPNGDILTIFTSLGYEPYGHGFARLNKDSQVLWTTPVLAHHDFDVAEDGTIYTLAHRYRDTRKRPVPGAGFYPPVIQEDFIVELSPTGIVRRRVSVLDAIAESPFQRVLRPAQPGWDVLHPNTVEIVSEAFAAHHPFAEPGQLMISCRSLDLIALPDMDKQRMVWVRQGFWRKQHGTIPMDNGLIMMFDNEGRITPGGEARSQVIALDPQTDAVRWRYGDHRRQPLYSDIRGWVQPLPNGNVLITESQQGRLLEVTRDGEVAWAFRHPVTRRMKQVEARKAKAKAKKAEAQTKAEGTGSKERATRYRPIVMSGLRVPRSDIGFKLNWRALVDAAAPPDASAEERARISWSLFREGEDQH